MVWRLRRERLLRRKSRHKKSGITTTLDKVEMITRAILNLEKGNIDGCKMCTVCSFCPPGIGCFECHWFKTTGIAPCLKFAREYSELPHKQLHDAFQRSYTREGDIRDYYLWFLELEARVRYLLACLYYYSMGGT